MLFIFTILNPVARHRKEPRIFLNILSITSFVSFQEVYTEQINKGKGRAYGESYLAFYAICIYALRDQTQ